MAIPKEIDSQWEIFFNFTINFIKDLLIACSTKETAPSLWMLWGTDSYIIVQIVQMIYAK